MFQNAWRTFAWVHSNFKKEPVYTDLHVERQVPAEAAAGARRSVALEAEHIRRVEQVDLCRNDSKPGTASSAHTANFK